MQPSRAAVRGFRVRLLETAGRAGRVHAAQRFAPWPRRDRSIFWARRCVECAVEDDKIMLDFAAYEWIEGRRRSLAAMSRSELATGFDHRTS